MKSTLLHTTLILIATTIFCRNLSEAQNVLETLKRNSSEKIGNYRLPLELSPKFYQLKMKFLQKPGKGFTFSGTVDIGIWVNNKTDKIVLHSGRLLVINRISIFNDKKNSSVKYESRNYDEMTEKMTLFLSEELPEQSFTYVNISYSGGILRQNVKGFYSDFNRQLHNIANEYIATEFNPIYARNAFPCFDEPQYKTNFTIEIERPSALKAISNMPAKNTSPMKGSVVNAGNSMEIDIFETSIPMPTYLTGFFISDFEYRRESNGKLTIWARPSAIDQIIYALGVITKARDFYGKYFSEIQNPLQKMDVVAIPNENLEAAGHLGLIVLDERNILHYQDYTSDLETQKISTAIFRTWASSYVNLVTPEWWSASWINDALATYLAYNATDKVEPEWKMDQLFIVDHLQSALVDDALVLSKALERDIETPTEIRELDDKMIRSKGASLLRMLDLSLDPSMFRNSLKNYLKTRMNQTSTSNDFWSFCQTEHDADDLKSSLNITEIMNTWTTQPGYPLVTVTVINSTVKVNQQRFTYDNSNSNSTKSSMWHIPLTWATERNPNFEAVKTDSWLRGSDMILPELNISHNEWIIFNAQQSGFYHVNYDTNTWNQIIRALQSENFGGIPVINRAAIIDDLFNLARAGRVEYSMALSATKYLINETSDIPWKAAMNNFDFIASRIANENTYKLFKGYISSLLNNPYLKIGFNAIKTNNHGNKMFGNYLRSWACDHGDLDCLTHALTLFKQWMKSSSEFVDPNYRETIYRVAANQDNELWDFLWLKYLITNVQSEKSRIIKALGTTTDSNKINELLSHAINPAIKMTHHESLIAFASIYSSGGFSKLKQTLEFLETNFFKIRAHFHDDNKVNIILSEISSKLMSEELVNQFRMIIEKDGRFKHQLQSYLSKANDNLNWSGMYEAEISRFLDQFHPKSDYLQTKNIKPIKYFVEMLPNLEEQFDFEGNVNITLESSSKISRVVLDSHQLDIKQIIVTNNNMAKLVFPVFFYLDGYRKLMILFGTDIPAETKFDVSIKYSGFVNETGGLYRSSYIGDDNETHWMIATQFRKYSAASAFPCIDDPSMQTEFYLKIFRRSRSEILSDMKLIDSNYDSAVNGSWNLFKESDVTSLQNVAFIVVNKKNSNDSDNEDEDLEKNIKTIQGIEKKTLKLLKKYTGLSYPVEAIRYGLIPDSFTDAPETWPFFAFSEFDLSAINKNNTPIDVWREMYLSVINKLVNIWLNKVVIPNSYKHMWMNEGLARYLQWFIGDRLQPQLKLMDQFVVYELQEALQQDSVAETLPINNDDLERNKMKYGNGTNYGKVASLLHMIRNAFSHQEFDESLKLFLSSQKNEITQPMDLWKTIEETLKTVRNASEHFDSRFSSGIEHWTDQPGYPIIHATIEDKNLTLIQHRFSVTGNNLTNDKLYWIPISIATKTNSSFKNASAELFLDERGIVSNGFDVKDGWFILNVQQTGFYRVNYNLKNWYQLFTALKNDDFGGIPEIHRAQIVDDLMNLARADYVSYELAFSGVEYLVRERGHLPWKAFFNAIDYLYDRFDNQKVSKVFANYLGKLIKPIYKQYKTKANHSDDTMMDRLNRQLIVSWACKIKYPDCIYSSRKIFELWRRNSTRFSISADVKETVLCTAIKFGNADDWNFVWEKYQASKIRWEKVVMLKALGCTGNRTIVHQYLEMTVSDDELIPKKYIGTVLSSIIASGQSNWNTIFHFLKENYRNLFKRFDSWSPVNKLLSSLADKITSPKKVIELSKFYADNESEFKTIMPNLNKIIESANHNVKWYDNHVTEIEYWLMSREHIFMSGQNDTHANIERINGILTDEECANHVNNVKIIIGSLIVVIVFLIIIAILGPYFLRKNRRRRSESVRKITLEMSMASHENLPNSNHYHPEPTKSYISHL